MITKAAIVWSSVGCVISAGVNWVSMVFANGSVVRWRGEDEVRLLPEALVTAKLVEPRPPFSLTAGNATIGYDHSYFISYVDQEGVTWRHHFPQTASLKELRSWLGYCLKGKKPELRCGLLTDHVRVFYKNSSILVPTHDEARELATMLLRLVSDATSIKGLFKTANGDMMLTESNGFIKSNIEIDGRYRSGTLSRVLLAFMALEIRKALDLRPRHT